MNWVGLFIAAGYVTLIVALGWPGVLAGAVHLAVLLLAVKRRP